MSDSFGELPKFPKGEAIDPERLEDHLPRRPEPETGYGDWLRHAWPALLLVGFGLFALFSLVVIWQSFDAVYVGCPLPFVVLGVGWVVWKLIRKPKP